MWEFNTRRVLLIAVVVIVSIIGPIAFRITWQAIKECQDRAAVQENLRNIGNALLQFENKQRQQQSVDNPSKDPKTVP